MLLKCAIAVIIFAAFEQVVGTDPIDVPETPQDKPANLQKGRLSLQNTVDIQHCLVNSGDVGCGVFECFENNSCEIRGLQEICMSFLHNAGKFDSQGKSFIKDALKCMAHGLRHKFSCSSRKCVAIKEMVLQLQRECYTRHDLCSAARGNVNVMVDMIHFQDLFPKGPHLELVNTLLSCGEQVKEALTWSVRQQCEQNWGALCESLRLCTPGVPPGPPAQPQPQSGPVEAETEAAGPSEPSQSPSPEAVAPERAGTRR
ncbi:stanniocalcin-2-like [Conger conger]|nr:stanniocalcin-2-like [Conger conger]